MTTDGSETEPSRVETPDVTGFGTVHWPMHLLFWREHLNVLPGSSRATWSVKERVKRLVSGFHPQADQWAFDRGPFDRMTVRKVGTDQRITLENVLPAPCYIRPPPTRTPRMTGHVKAHLHNGNESIELAEMRSEWTGFLKPRKRATINVRSGPVRTIALDTTADAKWITDGREVCMRFLDPHWLRYNSTVSDELAVAISMFCFRRFNNS